MASSVPEGSIASENAAHDGRVAWLVYDGDCPFCSRYVRYVRFRDAIGKVHLVNARRGGPLVDEMVRAGLDLDEGMVLKMGGRYYHAADCIHALAMLTSGSDTFNRMNAAMFRSPTLSRLLYPILRAGRNATLRALGRTKIQPPACDSGQPSSLDARRMTRVGARDVARQRGFKARAGPPRTR